MKYYKKVRNQFMRAWTPDIRMDTVLVPSGHKPEMGDMIAPNIFGSGHTILITKEVLEKEYKEVGYEERKLFEDGGGLEVDQTNVCFQMRNTCI